MRYTHGGLEIIEGRGTISHVSRELSRVPRLDSSLGLDPRDMRVSKEKEYISLKEAAEITGYSADYIGQLIRSGKLEGKQVFQHVVWVTTEDALEKYLKGTRKSGNEGKMPTFQHLFTIERLAIMYSGFTWFAITLFTVFILFLGYVFAVSIDHKIEQKQLERLNAREL